MNRTFLAPCLATLLSLTHPLHSTETLMQPLIESPWQRLKKALLNPHPPQMGYDILLMEVNKEHASKPDKKGATLFDYAVAYGKPKVAKKLLDMVEELYPSSSSIRAIAKNVKAESIPGEYTPMKAWTSLQTVARCRLKNKPQPLTKKQKICKLLLQCFRPKKDTD